MYQFRYLLSSMSSYIYIDFSGVQWKLLICLFVCFYYPVITMNVFGLSCFQVHIIFYTV